MSETSRSQDTSETNAGPDLFRYYVRGVAELLSQDDDFLPSSSMTSGLVGSANGVSTGIEVAKEDHTRKECNGSVSFGSLFSNAAGAGLSDFKKERVKAMLRQAVVALTKEVEEMLDPVISMRRLQALMASTKSCASYQDASCKDETENRALKKLKISSPSSSINNPLNASPVSCSLVGEGSPNACEGLPVPGMSLTQCCNRECAKSHTVARTNQNIDPNEPKFFCGDCGKPPNASPKDRNASRLGSTSRDDKETEEINDDLQVLLVNRGPKVEEKLKKYSAELSATLEHMEEKLEELLDIVISSCRPMTLAEKHQLCRLIQQLPPKNLDRVVEIICQKKPSEKRDVITVDLQHEDDLTLWRLYFYVAAIENARKLLDTTFKS